MNDTESQNATAEAPAVARPRRRALRVLAALLFTLLAIVGGVVLVADAMDVEPFVQTGHAMVPGLPAGTRFLRIPFRDRAPRRGEVVLVRDAFGGAQIVRRVVGVEGDRVAMDGFALRVNGRSVGARAACPPRLRAMTCVRERVGGVTYVATWSPRARPVVGRGEQRVPRGFVYVLADHRDAARDSRDPLFGLVPVHAVLGDVAVLP